MCASPPANPAGRPLAGGFTLLEVLAALTIFAITAVVLGAAYLNILNSYQAVGRGTGDAEDVAFARQELLTQIDLTTAENGDEFDTPEGHHVQWSLDPSNPPLPSPIVTDLFTVTFICEVSDTPTSTPRKYTETFMLVRPTWSDATTRGEVKQAAATAIAKAQGLQQ
jgi:prepilin-type N-terminal cleavage/methylation domain-containing protein